MSEARKRTAKGPDKATRPSQKGGKQLDNAVLKKKLQRLERTKQIRNVLLFVGLAAVAWFSWRLIPSLFSSLISPPNSSSPVRQTKLVRTPWGTVKPTDVFVGNGAPKLSADVEKREEIREAFEWSWRAYEKHAWGDDEFHPLSKGGSNLTAAGGVGYTIVDSIDSLLIMGFEEEYHRAAKWCRESLSFDKDAEFNTFETTIRLLGGLLSAHYLTSNHSSPDIAADAQLYLDLAVDLADRLVGAFDTPSGIPLSNINLAQRKGIPDRGNRGIASLAEAASLQLEMKYLSYLTGDLTYWKKAERVTEIVRSQAMHDGIAPIFISPQNGQFIMSEIRLGSRGDSYYEYLLKQWLQTDRQEPVYRDMYDEAMGGIKKHLLGKTKKSGLIYTQELHPEKHPRTGVQTWQIIPKQDHLVCFLGGSFLLGITEGGRRVVDWSNLDQRDQDDLIIGQGIVESCMATHDTETGLSPEIAMFVLQTEPKMADKIDWYIKDSKGGVLIDARNILRPETVESLFLGYRATGDPKYREWGWQIFQAFQEHCRVADGGYAGIEDVQVVPAKKLDRMETFWLGETLKYLYLLFDDSDHIPLSENIFNTEAHILPVFKPAFLTPFSTS
ncbi:glycoside hydrolase [Naematelia encephala]|uniref:alpha-1,2-Mannosidase n=1 Tax=Naematelia encephala TaxID=71784 RepID=A0A1Y2BKT6_9TREE|nr:glycoside hydrolase [Naematelia encephala]